MLFSSYANIGLLAAVSCTKVHNVTGNKYKFAQFVQETATNDHKCGQLLNKILTCYSRWCLNYQCVLSTLFGRSAGLYFYCILYECASFSVCTYVVCVYVNAFV